VSQINPVHATIPLHEDPFLYYPFIYSYVSLSGLFPSDFPTKTRYTPLFSSIRATCPAHLIFLDFVTRIIFSEQYSSLTPHYVVFSNPLLPGPTYAQIFCSAPYSQNPRPTFLPQCDPPSFSPMQNNRKNYSSIYLYIFWGSKLEDTRFCTQ